MKEVVKLLGAVLAGAAIALGAVSVSDDGQAIDRAGTVTPELRVIAEGRFQEALLQMFESISGLVEERSGVEVPPIEGPEPCVGISDGDLRQLCVDGLAGD